jgi:two-component system CheB/CheR fusion protein
VRKRPEEPAIQHVRALEASAPPSVLVDDMMHILHLSPSAGRFILHGEGTFSGKLTDVVRPELRLDLKIALDHAVQKRLPSLTLATPVAFDGGPRRIAVQVSPVPGDGNEAVQVLVVFLDAGPVAEGDAPEMDPDAVGSDEVRRLHGELRAAQEALVASRGEHEIAIEDLRAANEELQSINEEYRSTSEELETSKEELQSMNEELQTVNAELKHKLASISTAHSDLRNLTSATEVGTLFLDPKLRIRMFTPPMTALFNITEMDIGRTITDFTNHLEYDGVEEDARRVLNELSPRETEVRSRDGRWFIIRLRPYRTVEDKIDGVVLTFVDITSRRETERELRESEERYQVLFDSIDEGFAVMEMIHEGGPPTDYRFVSVNAAFERQTGLPDATGQTVRALAPDIEAHWFEIYGRIARTGEPERFEAPAESLGKYYDVYAFRIGCAEAQRVGALFRDVSDRKAAEAQREMLTAELSHRVKNTLAVVQALARSPGSASLTVDQYRKRLVGRIQALARAHDQLLQTHWQSADLRTLIDDTLSPYGGTGRRVVKAEGPDVPLTPKQGLGLALILHELATNASKYGSLSVEGGSLDLRWQREAGSQVRLHWHESGGPEVADPAKSEDGFGTRLIRQACVYELGGTLDYRLEPDGLLVEIAFPAGP